MTLCVKLIGAGAGSGKTTRVVRELMARLTPEDGSEGLPPSAIVVTTFTRKAAAELVDRVRAELLVRGREDLAARLGEGLIGTVDSVSGELVRRFAFDAGLSPAIQVLDEEGAYRAFAESLSARLTPETLDKLHAAERAFGLASDEDGRRPARSKIAERARQNGLTPAALRECAGRSLELLDRVFPGCGVSGLDAELLGAMEQASRDLPAPGDATKTTRDFLELLDRCLPFMRENRLDWKSWVQLARAKVGVKSRDAVEPLATAAARYLDHPRLSAELRKQVETVFGLAAESLETYAEWKRIRRLLDFTDMEAKALELLARPDVSERLAERVHLVLVDEFQDTSPLQLALFLRLSAVARESIWVGDPKQAIYGFRGTDPALMQDVLRVLGEPGAADLQKKSYRSRRGLVDLVSWLFVPAFEGVLAPEQVRLEAERGPEPELGPDLRHWPITASRERSPRSTAIAAGIARLLGRGGTAPVPVRDKATKAARPARPCDVAVLCRKGSRCEAIAGALEALGIRAARERTGLLQTPEAALVLACLRRLADRRDTLATAEIVSLTEDDPSQERWLAERLLYLQTGQPSEDWRRMHPVVAALERLSPELAVLSPTEVLDRVLDAADASRRVVAWGRAQARLGNLEALRGLAAKYEESCARLHAGASVAGLVHWLEELAESERDKQSQGAGPDAVQVLTLHASKGLEWPIVVLAETDWQWEAEPFGVETVGRDGPIDLQDPLQDRWVRYWPWPFGDLAKVEGLDARLAALPQTDGWETAAHREAVRLLYVAMTRARDSLILPTLVKSRQTEPTHPFLDLVLSPDGQPRMRLPMEEGTSEFKLAEGGATLSIFTECPTEAPWAASAAAEEPLWFRQGLPPVPLGPAHYAVSALELPPGEVVEAGEPIRLGERLAWRGSPRWDLLGNAIHACLGTDDPSRPRAERLTRMRSLLASHAPETPDTVSAEGLLARSEELRVKLVELHGPGQHFWEWPVRLRHEDVFASGWIDLAVRTADGWVLVDHKSFPGEEGEWAERASHYAAQLAVYAHALEHTSGERVMTFYIHMVLGGALVPLALPSGADLTLLVGRILTRQG
ncbi:MAG: UvrD-helicase domain-containing protein [Candidatus Wallbacteria bacterium]|nr:UvrD-helicase domain-containing protein [Candidatus Wallbacteria bacterium]